MATGPWWESDRRYFSLVADRLQVEGGVLFVSATFADLPPGFVASVPGAAAVRDPARWVDGFERCAVSAGARLHRAYLPAVPSALARCLEDRGYAARAEVGVQLAPPTEVSRRLGDDVAPVTSESDWGDELALQRTIERAWCDGDIDPERWVALERAQAAAGCTRHLIRAGGVPVASFGRVAGDTLRRAKSLVVHPCHRGRGHAATALAAAAGDDDHDARPLGAIAVEEGAGHRSYRRLGFETAFRFVEWSRPA